MKQIPLLVGFAILASALQAQTTADLPADSGMYVVTPAGKTKIVGQIVTFTRSGSRVVSRLTVGIKTRKENIQILGAHAQTVTDASPVFYFIPAKQESESGVNAGDVILVHLEEKSKRRQFEVGAEGLLRKSSGITLTHQIQLFRSEDRPGIYEIVPATPLKKGEYALYVARGNGLAAYIYDFSVEREYSGMIPTFQPKITTRGEPSNPIPTTPSPNPSKPAGAAETGNAGLTSAESSVSSVSPNAPPVAAASGNAPTGDLTTDMDDEVSIGAWFHGRPTERHDGVEVSGIQRGGAVEDIGMKAGDFILAIDDHYVFTIQELHDQLVFRPRGSRAAIRYRRHSLIYDTFISIGPSQR
jgi:hypothetical protein